MTRRFFPLFFSALAAVATFAACKDKEEPKPDAPTPSASSSNAASGEVKLPGIDTSALLPRERKEFSQYVTEFLSPCPEVAVPIAQCIQEKRACGKCMAAAK